MHVIALAIPFFFLALGLEMAVARAMGRRYHRYADSLTDLSCGIGDQVLDVLCRTAILGIYAATYDRFAIQRLDPGSWTTWAIAIVAVDFTYYWFHRFSHRVNFAWATHVVHHQSEEYNLAVALRQSWLAKTYHWAFDLPVAMLGVPPAVYATSYAINLLYQFWIHTRTIGTLGPFEWVFNTPSHHRVHHGRDAKYLDKNYAGILIVWDRLFGTFKREEEEPSFGTVAAFRSTNPLWANLETWARLGREARDARRLSDRLAVWFMPPEWHPAGILPEQGHPPRMPDTATGLRAYVDLHFVLLAIGTMLLMLREEAPLAARAAAAAAILATIVIWGGLLEARRWAVPLEMARLHCMAIGSVMLIFARPDARVAAAAAGLVLLASAAWLFQLSRTPALQPRQA
ncbi:MAG: sterol desaturase family protein [Acidobacteriota bacterium]